MKDGHFKPIQEVSRGDWVISSEGTCHQVARLCEHWVDLRKITNSTFLMRFKPHSLT